MPHEYLWKQLVDVGEYRDGCTRRHTARVGELSALLAGSLGVSDDEVWMLRHASALHDIGKVAIPDTVLLKPGPLSASEMCLMRSHTTIGARLLHGTSVLSRLAASIALLHHERWDGTGYPYRLQRHAIPLPARIVSVADAFDALTNDRPYRRARPVGEALAEIIAHRDTQFDGQIVDALARVVERMHWSIEGRAVVH